MKKCFAMAFCMGVMAAALSIAPSMTASATSVSERHLEWEYDENGKAYWYENGVKQGTYDDMEGILGDGTIRGREIYDPASNAWYWLDSCYDGAKAVNKEVWMPYTYQDELVKADDGVGRQCMATYYSLDLYGLYSKSEFPATRLGDLVKRQIMTKTGKWVRYDENGKMMKGWVTIEGDLAKIYPDQAGNTYYYDTITGSMVKDGYFIIDGYWNTFNENGVLIASDVPGRETDVAQVIPDAGYSVVTADMYIVDEEEKTSEAAPEEVNEEETTVEETAAEETETAAEEEEEGPVDYNAWYFENLKPGDTVTRYENNGYKSGTITTTMNEDGSITKVYGNDCGWASNKIETYGPQSYLCDHDNATSEFIEPDSYGHENKESCPDCGYVYIF